MGLIKKIWKDPVGSKVIAVIISPYVLALFAAIKGFFDKSGYFVSLKDLLVYSVGIPAWLIPIIILVTIYITLLYVQFRTNRNVEKCHSPSRAIYYLQRPAAKPVLLCCVLGYKTRKGAVATLL